MYRGVDVVVINKIDLLPYVPFRMDFFKKGIEVLNPGVRQFELSCQTGAGLPDWLDWLEGLVKEHRVK
jgi:hydrogenase nickel incorporation protein HypB